ncbi:MAG: MATE family efflux transporter [Pseudomonadota bacterium]
MSTPTAKFTTGSTMKHVVVMTVTSSMGLLALFLVDAINLLYISMLGVTELAAAIGFAGTLQFFMISVTVGLLIAGTAVVSRAIGAGEGDRARRLAGSSLLTAFAFMGVVGAVIWVFRREALMLLGAQGEALEQGTLFLAISLPSVPLIGIGMSCSGTLRAMGEARQAMYVTLLGGAVAAVLDPLLIFGLDLGLVGAAMAIVLTRLSIAMLGLYLVVVKHDMIEFPGLPGFIADIRPIAVIAGPAMLTQLSTPFGNAYLTTIVAEHGDDAVAGWAVIGRMTALAFGGIFALSGAIGPIIGQNYGAKLWPRIASAYRDGLIFATVYVLTAAVLLRLLTPFVVEGFSLTGDGAEILTTFTRFTAFAFVFTGALFCANAAFNNLRRPLMSTVFNWSRDAVAIPLLAFGFAGSLGPTSAVWIQAVAVALVGTAAAITGWVTVRRIAGRELAPGLGAVPDIPPVPAFASGRAVTGFHPGVNAASRGLASEEQSR